MFGAFIFTCRPQDQPPHYPVICVLWLLLYSLANFLDSFDHIPLLELCKSPVHVRVVAVTIEFLCLTTYVQSLFVYHMHIKQEGQIIIRERMCVIDQDASFEMLHSLGVVTDLEIGETKIVMQLGIVGIDFL